MSIDVEDWFHVENMHRSVPSATWERQDLRVERTTERMLELLAAADVKATFFVLGWVAERVPVLVRRIADAGHEVASHGYGHEVVSRLDPVAFREDVERSKELLEDISGEPVRGYRAPNFSITEWALPILREVGYEYDSSVMPATVSHRRYGKIDLRASNGKPFPERDGLTEIPLSCLRLGRHSLAWAGGGYFRLVPYPLFRLGVRRILRSDSLYVFYIHPWELDPGQPRVRGLTRTERVSHYLGLERTEPRWSALLREFAWMPIRDLIGCHLPSVESNESARRIALTVR